MKSKWNTILPWIMLDKAIFNALTAIDSSWGNDFDPISPPPQDFSQNNL